MSTILFIGFNPMAFNLFCINSGESFTFILSIINPQNLLQSLGFKISILKFGEIIVLLKLDIEGDISSNFLSFR
jgi:hypothetical protein